MIASQDFRRPATCVITVDGEPVTDFTPYLVEARVETGRAASAVCTLTYDTVRLEDGTWMIQDAGVFTPWRPMKIEADFGDYTEEIMRGYVKLVRAESPEQMGASKVTVICQDESLRLDRVHARRVVSTAENPMTDGEVAEEIATDNDFDAEVEAGLTNVSLNQDGTPIQLLKQRAGANGFELYVREGVLHMKPPELDGEPQPAIMVYSGAATNCARISVVNEGHRPDAVTIVRQAEEGTELESETFAPNLTLLGETAATSDNAGLAGFAWQMRQPAGSSLAEAQSRAQAMANENAWKISAEGELDGSLYGHVLLSHKVVGVYGIGDTNSGLYYVDCVTHIFDQTGYRQAFKLLRNATGQNTDPEAGDALSQVR